VARVKARLRPAAASGSEGREERIAHGGLVVDPVRHAVFVDSVPVDLTATQFRLLKVFARNPGRVFTRDELLTRVIRGDAIVTDRNIDVHVRAIRRKLGSYRDLIETIRGVGYRFGRPGGS
jgi:two-component system phosphate regulon response regulator PhoB